MPDPDGIMTPELLAAFLGQEAEDDDPVVIERRTCADCRKGNRPLNPDDRCDECAVRYEDLVRRQFELIEEPSEEVTFRYSVDIKVRVKDRSREEMAKAGCRAAEILLGFPMHNDQESWDQTLIAVEDEDGQEIEHNDD